MGNPISFELYNVKPHHQVLDKQKDMPDWARKILENQQIVKEADAASLKSPEGLSSTEDPLSLVVPVTSQSPPVSLEVPHMSQSPPVERIEASVVIKNEGFSDSEGAKAVPKSVEEDPLEEAMKRAGEDAGGVIKVKTTPESKNNGKKMATLQV